LAIETGIRVDLPPVLRDELLANADRSGPSAIAVARASQRFLRRYELQLRAVAAGVSRDWSKATRLHRGQKLDRIAEGPTTRLNEATLLGFAKSENMKRRRLHSRVYRNPALKSFGR